MTTVDTPVKGLMVADRPGGLKAGDQPAFIPACANDPWGLNPTRLRVGEVSRPKPPSVTDFHRKWLQDLEECVKLQRDEEQKSTIHAQAKQTALASFSHKLRAAILQGDDVSFWKASTGKPSTGEPCTSGVGKSSTGLKEKRTTNAPTCHQHLDLAAQQDAESTPPAHPLAAERAEVTPSPAPTSITQAAPEVESKNTKRPTSKPAWALSDAEAAKVAEEEEAELVAFAQGLDYDAFLDTLDDPTLREALQELHDSAVGTNDQEWQRQFVRAMNHVSQKQVQQSKVANEQASKLAESIISSRHSSRRDGLKREAGWDSCSVCEGEPNNSAQVDLHVQAAEFLRDNPDAKSVHSFASVRAVLAKALAQADSTPGT